MFFNLRHKRKSKKILSSILLMTFIAVTIIIPKQTFVEAVNSTSDPYPQSGQGITPELKPNNDTGGIADCYSAKFEPDKKIEDKDFKGIHNVGPMPDIYKNDIIQHLNLTYTSNESNEKVYVDWSFKDSTLLEVAYVAVKGGDAYNLYDYTNQNLSSDEYLHSPINNSNQKNDDGSIKYYAISHVTVYFKVKTPADPKGNIKIIKTWIDNNGNNIPSPQFAELIFELYKNDKIILEGSPNNGVLEFNDLLPGTYQLKENKISGYDVIYKVNGETVDPNPETAKISLEVHDKTTTLVEVINKKVDDPIQPLKGNIKITKAWVDSKGNTISIPDFKGSLFELYNNDQIILHGSPNNGVLEFNDLLPGTYQLKENKISGYDVTYKVNGETVDPNPETAKISLEVHDKTTTLVEVFNKKVDDPIQPLKGNIKITKAWVDSKGNTISIPQFKGSLFELYNNDQIILHGSPNNGVLEFNDLLPGTYQLKENKISGYDVTYKVNGETVYPNPETAKISLEVHDMTTTLVEVINKKVDDPIQPLKGNIKITKAWVDSKGNTISIPQFKGSLFELYNNNQIILDGSPNNGVLEFNDLPPGTYQLKENKISGYDVTYKVNGETVYPNPETAKISLEVHDKTTTLVEVINTKIVDPIVEVPKGTITITKKWLDYDNNTATPPKYSDKLFQLISNGETIDSSNPDSNGIVQFKDLPLGEYIVKEISLEGYETTFVIGKTETKGNESKINLTAEDKEKSITVINKDTTKPTLTEPTTNTDDSTPQVSSTNTTPQTSSNPLPKTDIRLGEEFILGLLGAFVLGIGLVLKLKKQQKN